MANIDTNSRQQRSFPVVYIIIFEMEITYDIDLTVLMVSYVNRSFVKDVRVRYLVMYEEFFSDNTQSL